MSLSQNIIHEIKSLIAKAKESAIRLVDHHRTVMYWHISERIFNEEQQGKDHADYGNYLIKYLSEQLQPEFGSSFSYRELHRYRQFYRIFPIASSLRTQLSWTHYKLLLSLIMKTKENIILQKL
jgi:hypothetical protein